MDNTTTKWDAANYLDSQEDIALYLEAAIAEDDPALLAAAIGDVLRTKGMTEAAAATGVTRAGLYRGFSEEGDPKLSTFMTVLKHIGVEISLTPKKTAA